MALDNKTKELIAIGASVTANCQPCLQYHFQKAIDHDAIDSEIMEAIEVGKQVRRGASAKMDKFAENILITSKDIENTVGEECGCEK